MALMKVDKAMYWALLLLCAWVGAHLASAIDAECSACEAVAVELQRRLDAEFPRTHLDMRHRLDKDGNRYGKVINYKMSDQRAVDLLDDLCTEMSSYTLISSPASVDSSTASNSNSSSSNASVTEDPSANTTTNNESTDHHTESAAEQLMWVKYRGQGSSSIPASKRPSKAEEDLRKKQLITFCGMMMERYEEQVLQALVTDKFATQGVLPVLCQQISSKCSHKQYQATTDEVQEDADVAGHEKQEL